LGRKEAVIITAGKVDPDGIPAELAGSAYVELAFVDNRATAMREVLEQDALGYAVSRLEEARGADLAGLQESPPPEVGIYHFIGHGARRANGLNFVPASGDFSPSTSVASFCQHLSAMTDERDDTHFLVVLDLCGAAEGLDALTHGDTKHVWVACAADGQPVYDGMFSKVVAEVIDDFAHKRLDTDETSEFISMSRLRTEFERRYRERIRKWADDRGRSAAELPRARFLGRFDTDEEPPFFSNPRYNAAAARVAQARSNLPMPLHPFLDAPHFADRAGIHFTGRASILTELGTWRSGHRPESGLYTLAGAAGSGKSALASAIVLTCHPGILANAEFGESGRTLLGRLPERCRESVPGPVAAVHARHRQLVEVTQSFIKQLEGTGSPALDADAVTTVPELAEWLQLQDVPPLLILDALDEAMNPDELVHLLLRPLVAARHEGRPACRMLVAGREREQLTLLEEAAAAPQRFDLDEADATELRGDLETFMRQVLDGGHDCCGAQIPDFARSVAAALADRETEREYGTFLVANLYAAYLNQLDHRGTRPDEHLPATPDSADARVPRSLPEVLELDFKRLPPTERRERRAVMAALAFARGDGMPARLAGVVARKVFDGGSNLDAVGILHDSAGIKVYLRSVADPTDHVPLYRLFHQGLNDYLREQPLEREGAFGGTAQ
jgi:hypothetical protein